MPNEKDWIEVIRQKDYLYIIRERLDEIDPRFLTIYTNIYLLIGPEKALLIDTGSGLFPIKPVVDNLIENRELFVVNTHSHFDHRGSNDEFETIYIHENEVRIASLPFDISKLKDSPKEIVHRYSTKGFVYQPSNNVETLKDGDRFELGDISVEVIHTPGHSIGCISLLTSNSELFTGDTAHYGTMYLPEKKEFHIILKSISRLRELCDAGIIQEIYPSHEQFAVGRKLLDDLHEGITNIENIWNTRKRDKFLGAWILEDDNFKYVI
jgi:glyoxylase-like metal-dependent hydrolase (beta-lactamase superfamily II)